MWLQVCSQVEADAVVRSTTLHAELWSATSLSERNTNELESVNQTKL
jgi:hypothetical protein